jgi:hypothetical protein
LNPQHLPLFMPADRQINSHELLEVQPHRMTPLYNCFLDVGREEREPPLGVTASALIADPE